MVVQKLMKVTTTFMQISGINFESNFKYIKKKGTFGLSQKKKEKFLPFLPFRVRKNVFVLHLNVYLMLKATSFYSFGRDALS